MDDPARRPPWRRTAAVVAAIVVAPLVVLAGLIVFGGPEAPPPMTSVVDAARAAQESGPPAPEPERFTARDGAELAYRHHPAAGGPGADTVAILIHGSAGNSIDVDPLARALAAAGVSVYAPDMRGHGRSGPRGVIGDVERLEEDLVDLVATVVRERYPDAPLILAGHSSGGGFVLRMAGEDIGRAFDRFVLLAPYLGHDAPTTRPGSGGWVDVGVPRIVALSILDALGIDWLHHLPVIAFALPPDLPEEGDLPTRTWSYALTRAFGPGADPVADAGAAPAPVEVLVGAEDEIMVADAYADLLAPAGEGVSVTVLPGIDHMGLILDPRGIAATVRAVATAGGAE